MAISKNSPKAMAAADRLPKELQSVYWRMVKEYAFLTETKYGRGYVAYDILADMVLAGWRPSAPAHPESVLSAEPKG